MTGLAPRDHGIVGNGWLFRDQMEILFWRQSNRLVSGEKIWEAGKRRDGDGFGRNADGFGDRAKPRARRRRAGWSGDAPFALSQRRRDQIFLLDVENCREFGGHSCSARRSR